MSFIQQTLGPNVASENVGFYVEMFFIAAWG
jgi:hypothetical protein